MVLSIAVLTVLWNFELILLLLETEVSHHQLLLEAKCMLTLEGGVLRKMCHYLKNYEFIMVIFFYYHFIFQAKLNHLHKFHPASQWEENFVWLQCLGHPDRGLQIMQV